MDGGKEDSGSIFSLENYFKLSVVNFFLTVWGVLALAHMPCYTRY